MSTTVLFTTVAGILAFVGAMYAWRFVLTYRRFNWEQYKAGQHLMKFTTGIAVILTWSVFGLVLRVAFRDNEWVAIVLDVGRILIFGWVAAMMFVRYQLLEQSEIQEEGTDHGSSE